MWPFEKRRKKTQPIQIGTFQLSAEMPNKRGIGCSVSVLQGEDLASINKKLDLCQEAIERQRTRCEIPELEAARDQRMKGLEQAREVLAELSKKQQDGEKLSSQEQLTLRNLGVNIEKAKEDIEKGDQAIVEAKRKAGVG